MRFENLFKPGKIGALEVKNRIIMPSMSSELCEEGSHVGDTLINWYTRRAKGGAGLISVEWARTATALDPVRTGWHQLRADDVKFIPGLTRLCGSVHEAGAKIAIQLTPGPGAQAIDAPWFKGPHPQRISPSGVPGINHNDQPRALTIPEIKKIVELTGESAGNVKKAGFDMIEIHAHGGYLIAEFMSPYFNKRTDEYGRSLDNRCRFLMEIIAAIREAVGPDFPVTCKYSIDDFLPGGWDTKQSQALAVKLKAAGVAAIGISSGVHGAKLPAVPAYYYPPGILLPFAKAIKDVVDLPVFVGGLLNDPRLADKVIRDNQTDFLYEGRALIADPDWPNKVASGQIDGIRPCLACNACRQKIVTPEPIRCSINATAGREGELWEIKPADKKRILIAGAGPGGMETARIAALRGHEVILCEKHDRMGGLMALGGIHNKKITAFSNWMITQLKRLHVDIRLKTEVTAALVEEIKPDAVVLAVGGSFVSPKVPGIDRDNVFSSSDLLKLMMGVSIKKGFLLRTLSPLIVSTPLRSMVTPAMVNRFMGLNYPIGKRVAVIGGQFPGCSLALFLAHKGKKVIIVEESERIGKTMEANTMVGLMTEVEKGNVKVLTSTKLEEVAHKSIIVRDEAGNKKRQEVDSVIVALDLAPTESDLAEKLKGRVTEVHLIGDARSFQRIINAVSEGYTTAYKL